MRETEATADSIIEEAGRQVAHEHKSGENVGAIFEQAGEAENRTFGTFNGVFRPTILTILGVMMYLREGWLVGNGGLLGAVLVILACYLITGTTAMSISSISTNIRVGSGGVFSIISQSLGLEVGGSVGIPLYLAQGLSAALYMEGIIETWMYIFPEHERILVLAVVFVTSLLISYFGAKLAFRVQLGVMILTILALASMLLGLRSHPINTTPVLWGDFAEADFQVLFSVFFPAATGIMVGASLSGNLKTPRRSIPRGTLSAWAASLAVYITLAVWYALLGNAEDLRNIDKVFAAEKALWGPMVLVGIMASCFSATLSSLVAAPRVLQALATYRVVPFRKVFEKQHHGEPRNATVVTAMIVLATLLLGSLNAIAQILTMFFLVIYFMINLVLFIEHRLKMISFRPEFPISPWVPIVGSLTCITAILIISPLAGLLAIGIVVSIYLYLDHLELETPWETVHSGIFAGIANWAAKKVITSKSTAYKRSWKPDLVVPIRQGLQLEGDYRIIRALICPRGSVEVADFRSEKTPGEIEELLNDFKEDGLFATTSRIEDHDFVAGLRTCLSVKAGSFFRPNTIFSSIENRSEMELQAMVSMAQDNQLGLVFLAHHPESGLGRERSVNLWVRDQSPNWRLGLQLANLDYAVLMAYQLKVNWHARVRLMTVVEEEEHLDMAREFLVSLTEHARLSGNVSIKVAHGKFNELLQTLPRADINIFGIATHKVEKEFLEGLVLKTRGSCLFVLDSGNESALA